VLLWSTLGTAAVLAASAAAVSSEAPAWVVFALAGLYTVVNSPYVPTEAALMPQLARTPQELSAANVTHSAMDNLGFLVGSILSGALLALTSIQLVFLLAATMTGLSCVALAGMHRDHRPEYAGSADADGVLRQTAAGYRALLADPSLRLVSAALTLLLFVEGAADVLIVIVALDLLGLADSSVGWMNAAWGIGALVAGAGLAVMLDRGRLAAGLVAGSLLTGAAIALPGLWPAVLAAYLTWFAVGVGYTLIEVAGNTLLQRLGDDEVLARARGSLETARFATAALGAIAVTGLVELVGLRGTVLAVGAILPLFALLRWRRLRSFEAGDPVEERHFSLLRADPIFAPLPMATLERLTHDLVEVAAGDGEAVITEGEAGDRFYLIESGEVDVLERGVHRRNQGAGESFGEIALLRNEPRTATVRALAPTRLLALERDRFLEAVTGHVRARESADSVIDRRLGAPG